MFSYNNQAQDFKGNTSSDIAIMQDNTACNIQGKGEAGKGKLVVLKGKVNSWLRQKGEVLAF